MVNKPDILDSIQGLAKAARVTRPTARRWREGTRLQPRTREAILRALAEDGARRDERAPLLSICSSPKVMA
jgi:hypothetical protein